MMLCNHKQQLFKRPNSKEMLKTDAVPELAKTKVEALECMSPIF